jgi:two-component system NarL family response regulator
MSERIRIVIADDHAPTRAGIRAVLERDGFQVCGEAASADAAVELALEERPAVCLLDINMPGGGIAAAGAISERLPETAGSSPPTSAVCSPGRRLSPAPSSPS